MKNILNIELRFGNRVAGTAHADLSHSFGFLFLQDSNSIASEYQRVLEDIEFLKALERIGLYELLSVARESKNEKSLVKTLMTMFDCSHRIAKRISEAEISSITSASTGPSMDLLLKYEGFLSGLGVPTNAVPKRRA